MNTCHIRRGGAALRGVLLYLLAGVFSNGGFAAELIRPDYVAAPPAAEDLLVIPHSPWVIVSAVSIGKEANPGLYAVSNTPPHLEKLAFSSRNPPGGSTCPGTLEPESFSPLGISMRASDDSYQLAVINRGGRDAIEFFSISTPGGIPELAWYDCVPLPGHISANSVVVLPTGIIYVTQQFDPQDTEVWAKRVRSEPTGRVMQWTADTGWTPATITPLSSPNGLAIMDDGCRAVVAAWSSRQLVRQSLPCDSASHATDLALTLPFMPDNLRWTRRQTLLVTGQDTTPDDLLRCVREGKYCPEKVAVLEVDPERMQVLHTWWLEAGQSLGLGTTAVEVGEEIWVSTIVGRLISRFRTEVD